MAPRRFLGASGVLLRGSVSAVTLHHVASWQVYARNGASLGDAV